MFAFTLDFRMPSRNFSSVPWIELGTRNPKLETSSYGTTPNDPESKAVDKAPATRMAPAREDQMFNNLIESNSHTREFKRRGSFFLFTVGAYVLLFVVAGVASIYAYDAHLDEQTKEIVTMLVPVDLPSAPKDPTNQAARAPTSSNNQKTYDERVQRDLIARGSGSPRRAR